MDQAIQRAGGDVGNKGVETAEAVIHVLLLVKEIQQMTTESVAECSIVCFELPAKLQRPFVLLLFLGGQDLFG